MTTVGTCALCLGRDSELQLSHIVPAWAYTRLLDDGSTNREPILMRDGKARQVAKHITEHLLCRACEQRLGVDDNYASTLAYLDGRAAILDGISFVPGVGAAGWRLGMLHPAVDEQRVARFAASVLWRAHVCRAIANCDVGDRYAESLRGYLLEERSFPSELSVICFVFTPGANSKNYLERSILVPSSSHESGYYEHRFVVCGLQFMFATGVQRPAWFREFCLVRSGKRAIFVGADDIVRDKLLNVVAANPPRGGLAKRHQKGT